MDKIDVSMLTRREALGAAAAACLVLAVAPAELAHADERDDLTVVEVPDDGDETETMVAAANGSNTAKVSAYLNSAAAVMADGSLWTLGSSPKKMLTGVEQVAVGLAYAAVKTDGTLWTWGNNSSGQVGDGTKTTRSVPINVLSNVASVSACTDLTAAVKKDGSLWMWGNGVTKPTKIMDGVSQVSVSGYQHKLAIVRTDGTLWKWDVGSGVQVKNSKKVASGVSQVSLNVWGGAFAAVKTDGTLWVWGDANGSLFGGSVDSSYPSPVKIMDGVAQVDVGLGHAVAVKKDGTLWTWGGNYRGQIGDETVVDRSSPVKVMSGVACAAAGGQPYNLLGTSFTVAMKTDGSLWTWGSNVSGQLSDGTQEDKAMPICVYRNGTWLSNDDTYHFAEDVPEREALQDFLSNLYWYDNDGSDSVSNYDYDSTKATTYKDNIIANLIKHKDVSVASLTDGTYPVTVFVSSGTKKTDPLGKFDQYLVCDASAVQWMVQNIFNVSSTNYSTLQNAGDNPFWSKYYYRNGKYYVQTGGLGWLYKDIAIMSATRSGDRYDVFFRIRYGQTEPIKWSSSETQNDSTYLYAQVGLKTISGKKYWSLYKLGRTSSYTATQVMHRLYNPNSGEHFYTASAKEKNGLVKVGWKYEGIGWTAPVTSKTPVYRLYSGTDHHYTTSAKEKDNLVKAGWKYEGIGWYSHDAKGLPLYRQFNPNVNPKAKRNNSGSHNYTTSKAENDNLVRAGWKAEGIGWYGVR